MQHCWRRALTQWWRGWYLRQLTPCSSPYQTALWCLTLLASWLGFMWRGALLASRGCGKQSRRHSSAPGRVRPPFSSSSGCFWEAHSPLLSSGSSSSAGPRTSSVSSASNRRRPMMPRWLRPPPQQRIQICKMWSSRSVHPHCLGTHSSSSSHQPQSHRSRDSSSSSGSGIDSPLHVTRQHSSGRHVQSQHVLLRGASCAPHPVQHGPLSSGPAPVNWRKPSCCWWSRCWRRESQQPRPTHPSNCAAHSGRHISASWQQPSLPRMQR